MNQSEHVGEHENSRKKTETRTAEHLSKPRGSKRPKGFARRKRISRLQTSPVRPNLQRRRLVSRQVR